MKSMDATAELKKRSHVKRATDTTDGRICASQLLYLQTLAQPEPSCPPIGFVSWRSDEPCDLLKCKPHYASAHRVNQKGAQLDFVSIVGLVVGLAGIGYAVLTNKQNDKQRRQLRAEFARERKIDKQRYEEEQQRAIEAQSLAEQDRQAQHERDVEQRRRDAEEMQQREVDRIERERYRDYLRRNSTRLRFNPKDVGWDAVVSDDASMITISNLTDKNFVGVIIRTSEHGANDWEGAEIARFSRISAHSKLTFPGKPTFNDVDRITIEGFYENVSEHLQENVPLAPEETMWEYRSGLAGNR